MKKLATIAFAATVSLALTANTGSFFRTAPIEDGEPEDTTVQVKTRDLDTIVVDGKKKKTQALENAINQSLNNGLTIPRQKSVSDVIGKKTTDKILHPFAYKERMREKNRERAKENMLKLNAAKSYEDELTEAIRRQLLEDSLEALKKK